MLALAVLPAPIWLALNLLIRPEPAWRAQYFARPELQGEPVTVSEASVSRYWDRYNTRVTEGIQVGTFSARWDTCVRLDQARDIPIMLVAQGDARFLIDGEEKLRLVADPKHHARGDVFRLEAGTHHLLVEFTQRGAARIALNASLDGRAPMPFPGDTRPQGMSFSPPALGEPPCGTPR
jgi:hypothetical protein